GSFFTCAPTSKLINSTASGTSARADGGGFGGQGSVEATNSTITGNRADSDGNAVGTGGGFNSTGRKLNNTIVAGNFRGTGSTPDDIIGTINTATNNIIGDAATSGGITNGTNGNQVGFAASAVLNTTLANNGGPTLTHALVLGGPAYNAGSNVLAVDAANQPLVTDQRGAGFPRTLDGLPVSGGSGLGAYPSGNVGIVGIVKGDGGGIFNEGALTVTNCTVSGNSSDMNGGGIAIRSDSSGTLTLTNSTVSGNSA